MSLKNCKLIKNENGTYNALVLEHRDVGGKIQTETIESQYDLGPMEAKRFLACRGVYPDEVAAALAQMYRSKKNVASFGYFGTFVNLQ